MTVVSYIIIIITLLRSPFRGEALGVFIQLSTAPMDNVRLLTFAREGAREGVRRGRVQIRGSKINGIRVSMMSPDSFARPSLT